MPCSYFDPPGVCTNPSDKEEIAKLRKELDKVTALLCELCQEITTSGAGQEISLSPEHMSWWKKHTESDVRRKYHEANKVLTDEINAINSRIKEIRKLGGQPSKETSGRLKKLKQDKIDLFNQTSKYVNLLPDLPRK